jgi:hypothetical protein
MMKIRRSVVCGCVVTFLFVPQANSQGSLTLPDQREVESEDWVTRRDAFARIIGLRSRSYSEEGARAVGSVLRRTIATDEATAETRKLILIELLRVEERVANEKRLRALAGKLPSSATPMWSAALYAGSRDSGRSGQAGERSGTTTAAR